MRDWFFLIVASSLLPCLLCLGYPDPLCAGLNCPTGQECRAIKPCGQFENCNITVQCIEATNLRQAGCIMGMPVLVGAKDARQLLTCYTEAPCPLNGYCSTELMDISSVCCRAVTNKAERHGSCPAPEPNLSRFFCVDECRSDADCRPGDKCCNTGCKTRCVPPDSKVVDDDISCTSLQCERNNKVCRRIKPCGLTEQCNMTYTCGEIAWGGCKLGSPLLYMDRGSQKNLFCSPQHPCPSGSYCSTELQDVASVCCESSRDNTPRPGTCPAFPPLPTSDLGNFCVDECLKDEDCRQNDKCCYTGCKKNCVPPIAVPPPPVKPLAASADSCLNMRCENRNQVCRKIKPCGLTEQCQMTYTCTESGRGGCKHGFPLMYIDRGFQKNLFCSPQHPCPAGTYCSTELQDVASVCCESSRDNTARPGTCPAFPPLPTSDLGNFCVDQCLKDDDCYHNEKCCNTGCKTECIPPVLAPPTNPLTNTFDPCDSKVCPYMTYCRRRGQPCRSIWRCGREGQCAPCDIVRPRPGYNIIRDPDGCPALMPKMPPPPQQPQQPRSNVAPFTNLYEFLFWLWSLN